MIKLIRTARPIQLTDKMVAGGVAAFKSQHKSVWNKSFLKKALLDMSHNKCCYCECCVTEEGQYMEVEHFHHKDGYPKEVLDWNNLFPACKRCNVAKKNFDTVVNAFINPCDDDPKEHMVLVNNVLFRSKDGDIKGKNTIDHLKLNAVLRLCKKRQQIIKALEEKIDYLELLRQLWEIRNDETDKLKMMQLMKDLLLVCAREQCYSAIKSTFLLNHNQYQTIKMYMQTNGFWTDEMQEAEDNLEWSKYELEAVPVATT